MLKKKKESKKATTNDLKRNEPVKAIVRHNLVGADLENFKSWVEEFTGGPNKCQVPNGGVCLRPDIILNEKCCNTCDYNEFCLCRSRSLLK